ncbi:hypothetical protein SVIOM342S_08189 [Streptomyces violaceorubidus]
MLVPRRQLQQGVEEYRVPSMPACTSPSSAKRAGMVVMSKSRGCATPTSSQVSGADTGAFGRGRTE